MEQRIRINILKEFYEKLTESQELKDLFFKTQVLNKAVDFPELELTNRGIHSMQVSITAGNIASNCGLGEEDIIKSQIIGLCHDLGHTPIGHAGEEAINNFVKGKTNQRHKFSHAEYSGVVLQSIIESYRNKQLNRIQASSKKGNNKAVERFESIIEVIDDLQVELINGVKNHTCYYEHQMDNIKETNAQRCGRLADSLSFMPSDLSDIMRADSETEPGKKIVEKEDINELKERLVNTEAYNEKVINEVIHLLKKGGQRAIPTVQEKIALEVSNLSADGKIKGISDIYKYTKEIDYLYRNNKNVAFKILEFDKYAKNHIDGYKGLDKESHALFSYQSMKELPNQFRGKNYDEKLGEAAERYGKAASDFSVVGDKNKEALEYKNKLDNYYKNCIEERLNNERKYLREKAPYLAATYELQDDLQYNNLILQSKTKVFGNHEEIYKPVINNLLESYHKLYNENKAEVNETKLFTDDKAVDYAVSKVQIMTNVELNVIIDKYPEVKADGYVISNSLPIKEIDDLAKDVLKERIASQDKLINKQLKSKEEILAKAKENLSLVDKYKDIANKCENKLLFKKSYQEKHGFEKNLHDKALTELKALGINNWEKYNSEKEKLENLKQDSEKSKKLIGSSTPSKMDIYIKMIALKKEQTNLMKNVGEINKIKAITRKISNSLER